MIQCLNKNSFSGYLEHRLFSYLHVFVVKKSIKLKYSDDQ